MSEDNQLTRDLRAYSKNIGLDLIGFTNPKLLQDFAKDNQPSYYLQDVKVVIIIGIYLYDIILDAWSQDQSSGKSFHYLDSVIENKLHLIKEFLSKESYNSILIPYSPGLFLKDAAALGGIGPIGKNNLIIHKDYGSQIRLRAFVSNAPLEFGEPIYESNYCKECNKCIEACPANALADGNYNKKECLAFCLENLRQLSKTTAIWCNVCIEACPIGKKKKRAT